MVLISRSLLNIGAGLLSVRASMRLRGSADPGRAQRSVFKKLIPKLAHGSVWREAGIEAGMGYEAFRERVPLHTYEDLAPHVEQMKRGEADVLWPGRCHLFSVSSGTTVGRTKYIPVTEAMLAHFRRAGLDSILWYTSRVGHAPGSSAAATCSSGDRRPSRRSRSRSPSRPMPAT
jgi:hypothetical protein